MWWWYVDTSINQWSWDCFTTLNFPPWQPSIAHGYLNFMKNHRSITGNFFKAFKNWRFSLERTGDDHSSALVVGSLLLFKSIVRIMGIYPKNPGLWIFVNFWGYESLISTTLITTTTGLFLFLITIQHWVVTSVEWVPEWKNPGLVHSCQVNTRPSASPKSALNPNSRTSLDNYCDLEVGLGFRV
jgi:hypothetical protein